MKKRILTNLLTLTALFATLATLIVVDEQPALAKSRKSSASSQRRSSRPVSTRARSGGRTRYVTQYMGSRRHVVSVPSGRHRGRRHHRRSSGRAVAKAPNTRYAYPLDFFMMHPPSFDVTPLSERMSARVIRSFEQGTADAIPARMLVRAGLVKYHPLRGGIFFRREPVKYVVVHSTETGIPLNAVRVIESWSSMGRRHPGAQYVVDRDGSIYQAVDPDLGTVHVNIFKTLPGINNDNSIGIEMCHTGRQTYPPEQVQSVTRLVAYLQDRYAVADENVITHRYAQQGDHTDPVHFDWEGFIAHKNDFRRQSIAYKVNKITEEALLWGKDDIPAASTFLQPHLQIREDSAAEDGSRKSGDSRNAAEAAALETSKESITSPASVSPVVPSLTKPVTSKPGAAPGAAATSGSVPAASSTPSSSMPALRGPIEVEPGAAPLLNTRDNEPEQGDANSPPAPESAAPGMSGESQTPTKPAK